VNRLEAKKETELHATHDIETILSLSKDECLNLEIKVDNIKGRGVYATAPIPKGQPVVEYAGDLLNEETARIRENVYAERDPMASGYMFFFKVDGKGWCVDATAESGRFGRLINHSKKKFNIAAQRHMYKDTPRLIFLATRDIDAGEEILFDYNETRPAMIKKCPWLKE
jgi:histone-lysine N-methyltransferase SETD8